MRIWAGWNFRKGHEVANYSFVLRGYVRHWLGQVWGEFDRVKLPDLVSPKSEKTVRQVAG